MEEKELSQMNVIPLVDVMLVLLTIVLITASFIAQGEIPVNLPEAKTGKETRRIETLTVTLTKEGLLYFRGKRTTLEELRKLLKRKSKTTQVKIRADRDVNLGRVIKVMDLFREEGFKKVVISVKRDGL